MNKRFLSALTIGSALALLFGACNKSSSGTTGSTTEGNWIKIGTFQGNVRAYAVSFTIGDSIAYVGSGQGGSDANHSYTRLSDFWRFSPTGNNGLGAWTQVSSMPRGRYFSVAFSIGSMGYVGTGFDDSIGGVNANLQDFYSFNTQSNTWSKLADFPGAGRQQAVGFAINGKGYIGTGKDSYSNPLGDFYEYDPSAGSWKSIAGYPGDKRYGSVSFVHNNLAYVVTGNTNNGSVSNDFFSFDGTNWSQLGNITSTNTATTKDDNYSSLTRTNAVAFVIGDWAYLATGNNTNTWAYYFGDDHWELRTPYQKTTRGGAVGFGLGSYGYVGTGNASGTLTANFSKFDPSETYDENADK